MMPISEFNTPLLTIAEGALSKLQPRVEGRRVLYEMVIGAHKVDVMSCLGQRIRLTHDGIIQCEACGRTIRKSYQEGYCFQATQKLAACDLCILKPELCHHHEGSCREPEWGLKHCFTQHCIYLSNTSGLKVGITRYTNMPARWLDQGAVQAIPIAFAKTRKHSGDIEVFLKRDMADKTHWKKMLQGVPDALPLEQIRAECQLTLKDHPWVTSGAVIFAQDALFECEYPVLEYPGQRSGSFTSLTLDRKGSDPQVLEGVLLGIKGQYLIFDIGVMNIRKFTGYQIRFESEVPARVTPILRVYPHAQAPFCRGSSG